MLEHEALELSRRVDKCNLERLNDSADLQQKLGMLGKSASRHLDHLKHALYRETQNLIDLAGKPGSVMFSAFRDEGMSDGGECFVTFRYSFIIVPNNLSIVQDYHNLFSVDAQLMLEMDSYQSQASSSVLSLVCTCSPSLAAHLMVRSVC